MRKETAKNSVYVYYRQDGKVIYVGKSKDVYKRHLSHKKDVWMQEAVSIGVRDYASEREMDMAEIHYISEKRPIYNKRLCPEKDLDSEDYSIRFIDYTEEEILLLEDFCEKYKPKSVPRKRASWRKSKKSLSAEEKIKSFHEEMYMKYGDRIVEIKEPSIGSVCALVLNRNRIIKLGNTYYKVTYLPEKENKKWQPPSEEAVKRLINAWHRSGNGEMFVTVVVRVPDYTDIAIPFLDLVTVDKDGETFFESWLLGTGTLNCFALAKTIVYEIPSLKTVAEFMKTKNINLIRPRA